MKRSDLMIASVILIIISVVVGYLVYGGDTVLGLSSADVETLIFLLPGVFVLFISFFVVGVSKGYMRAGASAGVGLSLVYLISLMNTAGLIVDDLDVSSTDLSLLILVVFMIIAGVVAVNER